MTLEFKQNVIEFGLEGIDGGGKSTQVDLLLNHYRKQGLAVVLLSGLSDTNFGRAIKRNLDLLNRMGTNGISFFKEDIRRSYKNLGIPEDFLLLLWDRHIYSIYAANTALPTMEQVREVKPTIPEPSRVFLLDLPVEAAFRREGLAKKGDHRLDLSWLAQRQERYQELARREPQRFCVVDANRPQTEVFSDLVASIDREIARRG